MSSSWLGDARHGKLSDNIVGFARALRRAGLPMDSERTSTALRCTELLGLANKQDLQSALRAVFVSRHTDIAVFNELFDAFFRNPDVAQQLLAQMLPKAPSTQAPKRSPRAQEALQAPRQADPTKPRQTEVELDAAMSASAQERLRHADFAALSASEYRLVETLARQIELPLPRLPSRRTRAGTRGQQPHWPAALKQACRHEGEVLWLPKRQRREATLPLLILSDVSGSMERYARLLLAFLHHATRHQRRAAYAFGTVLTDLNPAFRLHSTDQMLQAASSAIADFAGGTRMGDALCTLRLQHARQLVGRRSIVLIISDGLDTGEPEALSRELAWLRQHCRRLLWLNPLLRFDGYAPLASGAAVLHRHAHGMLAVHNLSSLQALAQAMAQLLRHP
jgi:uncharacterized protein